MAEESSRKDDMQKMYEVTWRKGYEQWYPNATKEEADADYISNNVEEHMKGMTYDQLSRGVADLMIQDNLNWNDVKSAYQNAMPGKDTTRILSDVFDSCHEAALDAASIGYWSVPVDQFLTDADRDELMRQEEERELNFD